MSRQIRRSQCPDEDLDEEISHNRWFKVSSGGEGGMEYLCDIAIVSLIYLRKAVSPDVANLSGLHGKKGDTEDFFMGKEK